jgi:hypothetical protein
MLSGFGVFVCVSRIDEQQESVLGITLVCHIYLRFYLNINDSGNYVAIYARNRSVLRVSFNVR